MDVLETLSLKPINPGAYSGANWQSQIHVERFHSLNPTTGEPIAAVAGASFEDYECIMTKAARAFLLWREVPAPNRGEIIRQIGEALRKYKDALGSLVSLEMGKSKQEGDGEVQEMIDMADLAVGQSRMLYGNTMHSERPHHRMYEQWHPYGIVGVISSFNFPVAVWAWNAFIAAVCGNVVLWKPSSKTPLCAIAVHHISSAVLRANNCPDIFHLFLPSSHELAEKLLQDKRLPLVSFTGSTSVGKKIASTIAARLGRTILELGGNNAIILDESANLNLAIPSIVFGAIGTSGQRCTSTRRLFIHKSIYKEVEKKLKEAYGQIIIGDPRDSKNHMGPLIDSGAVMQFESALARIKTAGGHIIFGGNTLRRKGFFVEPTLVSHLKNEAQIVQEETFAPILYLIEYDKIEEAIHQNNAVPQGLSSALFTENLKHAEFFLSAKGSDCGIANINIGTSGAEIGGAFGGEKDTGGGREAGSDAWKAYMRRQTNTINWGDDLPLAQGIKFDI